MQSDLGTGLLIGGAILLLAAVLIGQLRFFRERVRGAAGWVSRVLVALIGAALIVWGLASRPVDSLKAAHSAVLPCHEPTTPMVPDAATASLEQMASARKAFQAYDAAVTAYAQCLDSAVEGVARQVTGTAPTADIEKVRAFQVAIHNAAVDREQAEVEKFNVQVRRYKSEHVAR